MPNRGGTGEAPSLFRRLIKDLLLAFGIICAGFSAISLILLGTTYRSSTEAGLLETARSLAASYEALPPADARETESWARAVAERSGLRLTLVASDGAVLADSSGSPDRMENHGSRPEIAAALSGKEGVATRVSGTLGMERRYAAVPLLGDGGEASAAALRVSADLPSLRSRLKPAYLVFGILAFLAALLSFFTASRLASRIARPLGDLASAALALTRGKAESGTEGGAANGTGNGTRTGIGVGRLPELLSAGSNRAGTREVEILGEAFASMASEISDRIARAEAGESELGAILEAMTEALLVLDFSLRIRLANARARELFGLESPGPPLPQPGPELLKATRSRDLEDLASRAGASGEAVEAEIRFHREGAERAFLASARPYGAAASPDSVIPSGSAIPRGPATRTGAERAERADRPESADPRRGGIVLLLADTTRIRALETVRKDFVANVSHELRTPIQIIKGFSENLLGGGLEDGEQARRFVSIIDRNADRMENLVDDLLSLARLEQGSGTLATSREKIKPLIAEAVEILEGKAGKKGQELRVECPSGLEWDLDPGLFVQALVNLMGNAIQYSGENEPIQIKAGSGASGDLEVSVSDRGVGIPAADLPRIFERFYRVDKARSKAKGGTGLGLAIVKHIAAAHGGRVEAESWEGEGSVFTLILPAVPHMDPAPGARSGPVGGD